MYVWFAIYRKLKINIAETKHEMSHCAPLAEDNLYWRLFQGMLVLNERLCSEQSKLSKGIWGVNFVCALRMRILITDIFVIEKKELNVTVFYLQISQNFV